MIDLTMSMGDSSSNYVSPGKRKKMILKGANVDPVDGSLNINFEDVESKIFKIKQFDPSNSTEKNQTAVIKRIAHILGRFLSEDEIAKLGKFDTFNQLFVITERELNKFKGIECELLIVLNPKGYVDIPYFPNFISTEKFPTSWDADRKDKQGKPYYIFDKSQLPKPNDTPPANTSTEDMPF